MLFRLYEDPGEEDEKMNAFQLVINGDGAKNTVIRSQISKPTSDAQRPGFITRLQRARIPKFTRVRLIIY